MGYQLQPTTEAGERLASAAESLIPAFRERADQADREGSICAENYQDLMDSGVAAAFVPSELGGFGLESVHDWTLGIATLARGDGSSAIAINMHLAVSRGLMVAYRAAQSRGTPADGLAAPLSAIAAGEMLICATATERGTDNLHPLTEATRTEEGWSINGTKLFVTMSPVATHIAMNLRMRESASGDDENARGDDDNGDHIATTMMPIDTPGVLPQGDWDALGMRASGSQSIRFEDVQLPEAAVRRLGPWGQWSISVLMNRTIANLPLVGAFLGIAESAYDSAIEAVNKQQRLGEPANARSGIQHLVGEMEIELAKCQSILQRAATGIDEFLARHRTEQPSLAAAHEIMKDYQSAKWVVNRGAIDIVSKAMDLFGGAGFMNSQPLARLYRDVRAGPFMQPYAPSEAREYVGKVALGLLPDA
jgi:alkylation response protein AidB-like acyl-CoA dehydrogenase